jgi:hypothetical protein
VDRHGALPPPPPLLCAQLLLAVGESFDDGAHIHGFQYSVKKTEDRVSVWLRDAADAAACESVGRQLKVQLALPDALKIKFRPHSVSNADPATIEI